MNGYGVVDLHLFAWICFGIASIPILGFLITRIRRLSAARFLAWALVFTSVVSVEKLSTSEPYGTRMLLLIVALLWSMKTVVCIESQETGKYRMRLSPWLMFCVGWPGMRSDLFMLPRQESFDDFRNYLSRGATRIFMGCLLIAAAWCFSRMESSTFSPVTSMSGWGSTALLLIGLSLCVHFGFFNLLTGFWRWRGVRAGALFRAPMQSSSLTEFWGRRWNLAFSEMTTIAIYRPLKSLRLKGAGTIATMASFLFSGLLHELAISVPVGSGFGWPMLYFAIHGIAISIEKRFPGLTDGFVGRIWTILFVLVPVPILFHHAFLAGCVWPIIGQ